METRTPPLVVCQPGADDVRRLMARVWPGIEHRLDRLDRLDQPFSAATRLSGIFVDGALVAMAGMRKAAAWIEGQLGCLHVIHSVCTEPSFRGRGLASAVLDAWMVDHPCDAPIFLHATRPELYARRGFRVVEGRSERVRLLRRLGPAPQPRLIELERAADRALVSQLAKTRRPLSWRLSPVDFAQHLIADAVLSGAEQTLWLNATRDVLVVGWRCDRQLFVRDVLTEHALGVEDVGAAMGGDVDEITFMCTIDEDWLSASAVVRCGRERMLERGQAMVRGRFDLLPHTFAIPHVLGG